MSENERVIRQVYDAFARGDIAAALSHFHEDVEWSEAEHVSFWPGRAMVGHREVVDGLFAQIPEVFGTTWRIDVQRLHDCGATVIMQGRYRGVARSTGRPLAPQVAHVWDLVDGKVARFQQYTDTWLFAVATGVEPVEAPLSRPDRR